MLNQCVMVGERRGFSSIDALHDLYTRFEESEKHTLVVIVLSDHDPEGEEIPQVIGRTLRDDFDVRISRLEIIKAAITRVSAIHWIRNCRTHWMP